MTWTRVAHGPNGQNGADNVVSDSIGNVYTDGKTGIEIDFYVTVKHWDEDRNEVFDAEDAATSRYAWEDMVMEGSWDPQEERLGDDADIHYGEGSYFDWETFDEAWAECQREATHDESWKFNHMAGVK